MKYNLHGFSGLDKEVREIDTQPACCNIRRSAMSKMEGKSGSSLWLEVKMGEPLVKCFFFFWRGADAVFGLYNQIMV